MCAKPLALAGALAVALSVPALALGNHNAVYRSSASWFGPGLYGNALGCGGTLTTSTFGVAHKTLPCGTRLKVCYRHLCSSNAVVRDRGPFTAGRDLDLTAALARHLRFSGVHVVRWRVIH